MFNTKLHLIDLYLKMQLTSMVKNVLDHSLHSGQSMDLWQLIEGNYKRKRSWLIMSISNNYKDIFFGETDIGLYIDFYFKSHIEEVIESQWKVVASDGNIYSEKENPLEEVVIKAKKKERISGLTFEQGGNYSFFILTMFFSFNNRLNSYGSGDMMWGTGGGTEELGRKRTEHGEIYGSQYMDEWVIPSGGGARLRFWSHKPNYGSWSLKSLRDITEALEHGEEVRRVIAVPKNEKKDSIIEAIRYHLLINENGEKSVIDTSSIKIILDGTTIENKQRKDSVLNANKNMDLSTDYWLKH